jgi:hypothetical protein
LEPIILPNFFSLHQPSSAFISLHQSSSVISRSIKVPNLVRNSLSEFQKTSISGAVRPQLAPFLNVYRPMAVQVVGLEGVEDSKFSMGF